MNPREQGFLLLTSHLGDPRRPVLTVAQLRLLAKRMQAMEKPQIQRELTPADLVAIGYDALTAARIVRLMGEEAQLQWYLQQGARQDCYPITRVSPGYPDVLRRKLGTDSPGCLWAKGNPDFLQLPMISLVGSRDLGQENLKFAEEAGKQAALQGLVLVSGNARGADRRAQEACLAHGGRVISVVADKLQAQPLQKNVLYLSEESFDMAFTPQRALSRNRIIHCLGRLTLVAQCTYGKGGTWDGTEKNLRNRWSRVFCFRDGSAAMKELEAMGAELIGRQELSDLPGLLAETCNLFDQ